MHGLVKSEVCRKRWRRPFVLRVVGDGGSCLALQAACRDESPIEARIMVMVSMQTRMSPRCVVRERGLGIRNMAALANWLDVASKGPWRRTRIGAIEESWMVVCLPTPSRNKGAPKIKLGALLLEGLVNTGNGTFSDADGHPEDANLSTTNEYRRRDHLHKKMQWLEGPL